MKGELISVDVLANDQLQVYIKEETGRYSFYYQISTSKITETDCYHAEMYKDDIEDITKCLQKIDKPVKINIIEDQVAINMTQRSDHPLYTKDNMKCLGGEGKLVAVNIQDDQIAVVREVEGKIYLVLHYTSKDTKTEVYKVEDKKDGPSQVETGNSRLIAMYFQYEGQYQDQQVCYIILLQDHEGKEYCAVRKMKRKDTTPFQKSASFNVQDRQRVQVVPNDPDTECFCISYNQHTDKFEEAKNITIHEADHDDDMDQVQSIKRRQKKYSPNKRSDNFKLLPSAVS